MTAQRRLIATGRIRSGSTTIETVIDNHPDKIAEESGLPPWFPRKGLSGRKSNFPYRLTEAANNNQKKEH